MNNFKRLEEELENADLETSRRIIYDKISNLRTTGNVVELYLSKVIDLFVVMAGGKIENTPNRRKRFQNQGYPTNNHKNGPSKGPSAG